MFDKMRDNQLGEYLDDRYSDVQCECPDCKSYDIESFGNKQFYCPSCDIVFFHLNVG